MSKPKAITTLLAIVLLAAGALYWFMNYRRGDNKRTSDGAEFGSFHVIEGYLTPRNLGRMFEGNLQSLTLERPEEGEFFCDAEFLRNAWPEEKPIAQLKALGFCSETLSFEAALRLLTLAPSLERIGFGEDTEPGTEKAHPQYSPDECRKLVEASSALHLALGDDLMDDACLVELAKAKTLPKLSHLLIAKNSAGIESLRGLVEACTGLQELTLMQNAMKNINLVEAESLAREGVQLTIMNAGQPVKYDGLRRLNEEEVK